MFVGIDSKLALWEIAKTREKKLQFKDYNYICNIVALSKVN
jgi:hypothetical protein